MRRLLFLILILTLVLAGCAKSQSLVGTWLGEVQVVGNKGVQVITFGSDGRFNSKSEVPYPNGVLLTVTDKGTWKLEGDRLILKMEDIDWKFAGSDASAVEKGQSVFKAMKDQILAEANANPGSSMSWSGSDSFTLEQSDGVKKTYRRMSKKD